MDSKPLIAIDKTLRDISQRQDNLLHHVTTNSQSISDQAAKKFHKLSKLIKKLEGKLDEYYTKLIVQVNQIATEVKRLKQEKSGASPLFIKDREETRRKRTDSGSDTDISNDDRDDKAESDSGIRFEDGGSQLTIASIDLPSHEKKTSFVLGPVHHEETNREFNQIDLQTDGDTTSFQPNNFDTSLKEVPNRSVSESEEDNEIIDCVSETTENSLRSSTSVKSLKRKKSGLKPTRFSTETSESEEGTKTGNPGIETHQCRKEIVKSVRRNEFGFKQNLFSQKTDNRVAFHHRESCYEGIPINQDVEQKDSTEDSSPLHWNIQPPYLQGPDQSGMKGDGFNWQVKDSTEEYGEYGVDNFDKPKTMKQWHDYAEQLRTNSSARMMSGCIKRGSHGHDVILVLDCSERMRGKKFQAMQSAANEYVEGIQSIHRQRGLEDNIGLAVFGGHSTLVLESTSDYELVKTSIASLHTGGDAPLHGGLLMGLAGVLGGASSQVLQNSIPGYMIVFTDSTSDKEWPDLEESDVKPSYFTGDFQMKSEGVIDKIAGHSVKICYVPIGENSENSIMEQAVKETKGKVIQTNELYRLIRWTQVLILAAQVAFGLRQEKLNPTREIIRNRIIQKSGKSEDAHDDCVDLVIEFMDPLLTEKRKGVFSELTCNSLTLGDRVRRGKNWQYDDQDSGMAGTVIGQEKTGRVWVEWDNSHVNVYHYDELGIQTIRKVSEPRDMSSGFIQTGFRVVRGPAWCYGDDDGGIGSVGTVLSVKPDGSAVVRWDCSLLGVYRVGFDELCEVQISSSQSHTPTKSTTDHLKNEENLQKYPKPFQTEGSTYSQGMDEGKVLWECRTDGGWKLFDQALSWKMEMAYHKKPSTIIIENGQRYTIDFKSMLKVNVVTREKEEIRRRDLPG